MRKHKYHHHNKGKSPTSMYYHLRGR